jgi:DegV family protein with EDD domain
MEKIGLLLDSTTLTREDIRNKKNVKVVSLNVTIDGVDQPELSLSTAQIVEKLHTAKKLSTSQPSPGSFSEKYEEFYKEGYTHVLVVCISSAISGTYQSALIAKSLIDFPLTIEVRSPKVASFGIALGIPLLGDMIEKGKTFQEVLKRYETIYAEAAVMFTLSDLMHLFRGGRLGMVAAFLGTVLRIKPIVEMVNGKLVLTKKERTNLACFDYFMEKVKHYADKFQNVYVDIIQLNRPEWAEKLDVAIKERFPKISIHHTTYVSPVFFIHLGDQGFGLSIIGE